MNGKKKTIIIVALLLVVFIGSISYALWSVTLEQTDSNVVKTGCFTVDMVEQTDEINLPEEYPVTDAEGRKYSPFTFTIQNTCTIDSSYSVNLKVDSSSTLEHQYVKAVLDGDKAQVLTDYEKATNEDKYQLTTGTLAGASSEGAGDGESVTYNLRLWLDADTPKSQMSKDFYAKIVIENITTSGVVAKEVLATADISEAQDGSMVYNYYNTGELEISGTGRMKRVDGYSIGINILRVMSQGDSEFAQSLTEEEKSLILSVTDEGFAYIILNIKLNGNYEAANSMLFDGETCTSEITDFNSFNSCIGNLELPDELLTLLDKMNQYLPEIKEFNIQEGVESLADYSIDFTNTDELIMPSSMIEIGDLILVNSNIKFNDTLQTLGKIMIITDNIIEIPNSVTKFSGTTGTVPMTIKLPKNNTYTTIATYAFDNSENITLIIPDTITKIENYAFASSTKFTLNFECSEENKPEGIGLDEAVSKGFAINYNYEYDFGE